MSPGLAGRRWPSHGSSVPLGPGRGYRGRPDATLISASAAQGRPASPGRRAARGRRDLASNQARRRRCSEAVKNRKTRHDSHPARTDPPKRSVHWRNQQAATRAATPLYSARSARTAPSGLASSNRTTGQIQTAPLGPAPTRHDPAPTGKTGMEQETSYGSPPWQDRMRKIR